MRCLPSMALIGATLSAGSFVAPAQADPFLNTLPISITGPQNVLEGQRHIKYTFTITNNTGQNLILDFALATIDFGPPDPTDNIVFSGVNGDQGLSHASLIIPKGTKKHPGKGIVRYSVYAPGDPFEGRDFGIDPFNFWVEYSTIKPPLNVPALIPARAALLDTVGATAGNLDPAALATLENCVTNPVGCTGPSAFLYPPSANPGFQTFGGHALINVRIHDIPEPPAPALIGSAILGLFATRARRRGRSGPRWPKRDRNKTRFWCPDHRVAGRNRDTCSTPGG